MEAMKLIEAGGELMTTGCSAMSPLHHWTREGRVELVKALLETPKPINYRTVDEDGSTPFHSVLCGPAKSGEMVRELMAALIRRMKTIHGMCDTGECADEKSALSLWEVKNAAEYDILRLAITSGQLFVVYPLIKSIALQWPSYSAAAGARTTRT